MADLFCSNDLVLWSKAQSIYDDVLKAADEQKNKRKGANKDQESLYSLDTWWGEGPVHDRSYIVILHYI